MLRRRIAPLLAVALFGLALTSSAQAAGGSVMVWGYNASGGAPVDETSGCFCVSVPVQLPGLSGVVQMAGGYQHGLALLDDGTVMAMGRNDEGQLGDGTTTSRDAAAPVPGLSTVVAVAAGERSSLALLADGSARAWGANDQGALGSGTDNGPEACGSDPCSKVPIAVPGVSNAIAIAMGEEYALALRADGTVLAWGDNEYGTLGDGTGTATGCRCVPSPSAIPGLSGVVAISAGESVASALLADGTVRTWGYNSGGNLGTGVESNTPPCFCLGPASPTGVSGASQVASGQFHQFAVLSSGAVMGWGANDSGQVGLGFTSTTGCQCVATPAQVPGLASPVTMSAGFEHSLALLPDGTGSSWGYGYYGELGNGEGGDGVERNSPGPISSLAGASDLTRTELGGYAIVGPKQTLDVAFAGAGAGKVGGDKVLCPPTCSATKPQGRTEILRAEPSPGTGFAGFTGACTGTGACQVRMSGDQTVTATFGPPKGTRITAAKINRKKKKATFSFTTPGAVSGYECKLIKPKPKRKKGRHKGKGARGSAKKGKAKKPLFKSCKSPQTYKKLQPGRYKFQTRGLNSLGTEAKSASKSFRLKKKRAKARKDKGRR